MWPKKPMAVQTLLGWEEGYGKDKKYFGLASRIKGRDFPIIESTFQELEIGFPEDEYLEAFAFQIAQRYLYHVLAYKKDNYKDNCEQ